ncbi:hypothetical protein [Streptomyces sp. NPDC059708]|uniref:hypothetical protein n=1 Tax=Streptomyces sp. NPDC059708 TaxID=3346916 RepID=UPI0036BE124C
MYRIVRTTTHAALVADLDQARTERDQALAELDQTRADAAESEQVVEDGLLAVIRQVTRERDVARIALAETGAELAHAQAQVLLDAEDRVALRALLRTARKQGDDRDRVYVLFRRGSLHSLHRSAAAAEKAAEAEGAAPGGWTAAVPGAALPPASEVAWRVQALALSAP